MITLCLMAAICSGVGSASVFGFAPVISTRLRKAVSSSVLDSKSTSVSSSWSKTVEDFTLFVGLEVLEEALTPTVASGRCDGALVDIFQTAGSSRCPPHQPNLNRPCSR